MIPQLNTIIKKITSFLHARSIYERIFILSSTALFSILTFVLLLFLLVLSGLFGHVPNREELLLLEHPSASEVYSADSILLGRYFLQERSTITYDKLPDHVVKALLATEDIRFYEHHGIDKKSMARVLIKSLLLQSETSGGGSTLTQQLAKNLFPRKSYLFFSLFINKLKEMIIASRLEEVYDKQSILTLYLNTVSFGENTFGLDAASQLFFSSPAERLSLDHAAVLIGMLKANHYYNPRLFPDRAVNRRNVVFAQMAKYNMITAAQQDSLKKLPLKLTYSKITHHSGLAPYFREYIRAELLAWCERYNEEHNEKINLYTSGLKVYTTIDSRMQRYAEQTTAKHMAYLQKIFNQHWKNREPWETYPEMVNEIVERSDHYKRLKTQGLSHLEIMNILKTPVPMTIFDWDGEKDVTLSPIDSLKHYLKFLQTGILAMDPAQGAIRVWVGGINHQYFQFDHVRESTKRQVGSTFKPIVYAAALEQGINACDFISAEQVVYSDVEDWAPANAEDNYGLKYSMPGALAYSINTVSVRVLEKAGIENTVKLAHDMGITSDLDPVPSIALGTPSISMLEMVTAYSAFAQEGKTVNPFYITSITSHENEMLEQFSPGEPVQSLSSESALLILHMLRRAINEGGTGSGLRSRYQLTNDIAGKTGTTQSNADGWFMAITPHLVIGTWVGADDPRIRFRSTDLGQGSRTALPLVGNFLQLVNRDASLSYITKSQFAPLPHSLERKIDCDFFKTENTFFKRIFAKDNEEKKRQFGKPDEENFFKRMFKKENK